MIWYPVSCRQRSFRNHHRAKYLSISMDNCHSDTFMSRLHKTQRRLIVRDGNRWLFEVIAYYISRHSQRSRSMKYCDDMWSGSSARVACSSLGARMIAQRPCVNNSASCTYAMSSLSYTKQNKSVITSTK